MCKRAKRWGIAVAVAMAFSAGLVGTVRAADGQQQQILDAFRKGITFYETGEYAAAQEAFAQVLAMDPSMGAALKMGDMAEVGVFYKMTEKPQLKADVERILDLMLRAARQLKREVAEADRLVEEFQSADLVVYGNARIALQGHGPYAVPYVVGLLELEAAEQQQQTVVAHAVSLLANLQRDACLPLIRVLGGTDSQLLKTRVADVLGQIGDGRAVPALMAVLVDAGAGEQAKASAARAVVSITGQSPQELGSAVDQSVALGGAYFEQDGAQVGYTYGMTADIWEWNPAGEALADKVVYEEVPNYLYYQRMTAEVALDGLAAEPGNKDLQALLAAALVRQFALCEFFKTADIRLGGQELEAQVKQDAAQRAAEFAVEVPVVLRMLAAPVLAQALQLTLGANDGPASLLLVKTLGDKLAAAGPDALDAETAVALAAALGSGDKDVRYNAAIVLVSADPAAALAPAQEVMDVMGAALAAAADRNALVIMDNFELRNKLVKVLRDQGVATIESGVLEDRIESALTLEPSVDIIFLAGNVPAGRLGRIVTDLLGGDPRTKAAPLYVVLDPADEAPGLGDYANITAVLSTDDLRSAKIQPILQEQVFAQSRSAFTEQEEALVLKAARALDAVNPLQTQYPLGDVELPLIKALTGYSEEVASAAVGSLAAFGSGQTVDPLSRLVAGEGSEKLRVAACRAAAAVLKRTVGGASEEAVAVLTEALAGDVQALKEAAAEALSAAGLSADDVLLLLRTEGLGEQ